MVLPLWAVPQSQEDAIVGIWVVAEKDAHVYIYRHRDAYFGKIAWLKVGAGDTGTTASGAGMYEEPRVGMTIMKGFRFDGAIWKDGVLYDPTDGRLYKGILKLDSDDVLHVRGFIGARVFGRTTLWQRLPQRSAGSS